MMEQRRQFGGLTTSVILLLRCGSDVDSPAAAAAQRTAAQRTAARRTAAERTEGSVSLVLSNLSSLETKLSLLCTRHSDENCLLAVEQVRFVFLFVCSLICLFALADRFFLAFFFLT